MPENIIRDLMKGAIFYLSSTGHTRMACEYISSKINTIRFDPISIMDCKNLDMRDYSVIGFAFPTFYMGIEEIFTEFLSSLENGHSKPCFLLNTYGMMQGQSLKIAERILSEKGFKVIAWHALMMPENYPPLLAKNQTGKGQPKDRQMGAFNSFITELSDKIENIGKGLVPEKSKVKIDFFNNLIKAKSRESVIKDIGEFRIDEALCRNCGTCAKNCRYQAIVMKGKPVSDMGKCRGCWTCFNSCPQKAISTGRIGAAAQYAGPDAELRGKFKSCIAGGENV